MVIGIAGGSGSGKTTFARKLLEMVGPERGLILEQDSYYKDQSAAFKIDPKTVSFDHPSSIDFAMMTAHLRELKAGRAIQRPRYDFVTHSRYPDSLAVSPKATIIVEGILIFAMPELFKEFDVTFFMEASEDLRLKRRIARDIIERGRTEADVRAQFMATVKPVHDQFVQPTKALSLYVVQT